MKMYYCNSSMKFNLDSMYTLVHVIEYEFESGERTEPITICGKTLNNDLEAYELRMHLYDLLGKAVGGKVTGKEYGEIKSISQERQIIRYLRCIDAGMSESDASYAFTD